MEAIQQNLKFFYEKEGIYNDEIPLLVMNKFISYNNPITSAEIDQHFFKTNQQINIQRLFLKIQQQKVPYITYYKEQLQEDEFEFLFTKIRHFYQMSIKDFNKIKDYYVKLFQNKDILREYFIFFGISKDKYFEYNLEFKKSKGTLNDY